jgi:hypothetical protein
MITLLLALSLSEIVPYNLELRGKDCSFKVTNLLNDKDDPIFRIAMTDHRNTTYAKNFTPAEIANAKPDDKNLFRLEFKQGSSNYRFVVAVQGEKVKSATVEKKLGLYLKHAVCNL